MYAQHTATTCNTLQRTATHCNALQHTALFRGETHSGRTYQQLNKCRFAGAIDVLQNTATHCNTLQHTKTHSTCTYQQFKKSRFAGAIITEQRHARELVQLTRHVAQDLLVTPFVLIVDLFVCVHMYIYMWAYTTRRTRSSCHSLCIDSWPICMCTYVYLYVSIHNTSHKIFLSLPLYW